MRRQGRHSEVYLQEKKRRKRRKKRVLAAEGGGGSQSNGATAAGSVAWHRVGRCTINTIQYNLPVHPIRATVPQGQASNLNISKFYY